MNRPEQAIHRQIISGLRAGLPRDWIVAHAANGGYRTKAEAGIFKAMGVVPGFPDIMILGEAEHGATCWFFEVKAGETKQYEPTPIQLAMHERLRELGFAVAVVCSWDQTKRWCSHWQLPLRIAA